MSALSIGFASAPVQSAPVRAQERPQEATEQREAPSRPAEDQPRANVIPPVAGSGGAISLEAVTALQGTDSTGTDPNAAERPTDRRDASPASNNGANTDAAPASGQGVIDANDSDAVQAASNPYGNDGNDPAAGEETDQAGRPAGNPLNLQI
ncbi:hypothetical protein [Sneathiella chinensis]|nr:hypothetical protein [Sneathiella chinensis]